VPAASHFVRKPALLQERSGAGRSLGRSRRPSRALANFGLCSAAVPSFDVVSKVDWAEFTNALTQAEREISQRFDFKGTETTIERNEQSVLIESSTEDRARAGYSVLEEKLIRRKVSLKHLEKKDPTRGPKGSTKLLVLVKEGIEPDKARQIVKMIKEAKLKVQASIHEDSVRVTGKKKDDLQSVMQLLRADETLELDLQFINFRD
jgi:uncharacterized protein YajQ (UPF0234 family)